MFQLPADSIKCHSKSFHSKFLVVSVSCYLIVTKTEFCFCISIFTSTYAISVPLSTLSSAYSSSNLRNMTTTSSRTRVPEGVVNLVLRHFDSTDSEPDLGDPSWWTRILSSTMNEAQETF